MPSILTGLVDTEDILADRRVVDMDNAIKMLDVDNTQFYTWTSNMSSTEATREKVNWLEDELFPYTSALAASAVSAVTGTTGTLSVTTNQGTYFRAKDIVRNQVTGEAFRVESISNDDLTVTRGLGSAAAASSVSGAQLAIVGNASAQGATLGTRKITKQVLAYNYTQIFRHPFGFTGTEAAIELYGGREPEYEMAKKLIEHKGAIERALFFGPRGQDTSGSTPVGTLGGAIEFISTNAKNNSGAAISQKTFDSWMTDGLQHGSKNKVLYVSPVVALNLSQMAADKYLANTQGVQQFGIHVDGFLSGAYGWSVPVIVKRDWNNWSSASGQYGGSFFLIDMDAVKLRPLRGRNTKMLPNRQAPDADEVTHEYLTEITLQFSQEKQHLFGKGIIAPS